MKATAGGIRDYALPTPQQFRDERRLGHRLVFPSRRKKIWCRRLSPKKWLDVSPICSNPSAVPSAIHAAADAYHHHHGNRRGKSAGCGHVCLDWLINGQEGAGWTRKRLVRYFVAHLTLQMIISTVTSCLKSRFKLNYVCIQNDSKIYRKNIFRTICTFISHVLGMEAKFKCLRWIIQTSMPKVV